MNIGAEKRTILVADDDRSVITMLRRNLENNTLKVKEATTGIECIGQVMNGNVALIIMDIGLPDLNGWGILCLLRLTESTARIPVIMMAADPPDRASQHGPQPDEFIQKPFDMRDLLSRVGRYIGPVPEIERRGSTKGGNE